MVRWISHRWEDFKSLFVGRKTIQMRVPMTLGPVVKLLMRSPSRVMINRLASSVQTNYKEQILLEATQGNSKIELIIDDPVKLAEELVRSYFAPVITGTVNPLKITQEQAGIKPGEPWCGQARKMERAMQKVIEDLAKDLCVHARRPEPVPGPPDPPVPPRHRPVA